MPMGDLFVEFFSRNPIELGYPALRVPITYPVGELSRLLFGFLMTS